MLIRLVPLATAFLVLLTPAVAVAAPSLSLVWTSTTGTGATGSSTIDAEVGDELELGVVVTIDAQGFTGTAFDLVGSAGLAASANTLVPGAGGPPECPSPPNLAPGTCFSATFRVFVPLILGVTDSGSSTTGYDIGGTMPEFVPSTLTVGAGKFTVGAGAGATETVETFFAPGVGGVTDGNFAFTVPAVAMATINVGGVMTANVEATKSDALLVDLDGDGDADPGDSVRYTVALSSDATGEAQGVTFTDTPGANTELVVGSVTTSQGTISSGNVAGDASITVDVGTLPASTSESITFDVTIASPLPDNVFDVANQGEVSGSNFATEPTDDPDTAADDDATVTDVDSALDQCNDELLACLNDPPFLDADMDGEHDATDACPATPSGEAVDSDGCSQAEFCAAIDVAPGRGILACKAADWKNDEGLSRMPGDCDTNRGRPTSCEAAM